MKKPPHLLFMYTLMPMALDPESKTLDYELQIEGLKNLLKSKKDRDAKIDYDRVRMVLAILFNTHSDEKVWNMYEHIINGVAGRVRARYLMNFQPMSAEDIAEDVAQDASMKLLRRLSLIDISEVKDYCPPAGTEVIKSWCFRQAKWSTFKLLKRMYKHDVQIVALDNLADEDLPGVEPTAPTVLDATDRMRIFTDAVASLRAEYRLFLGTYIHCGGDYERIATEMGISKNAVRVTFFRVKKKLKEYVDGAQEEHSNRS